MTQTMTNTELIRRGYQAFNEADLDTLATLFTEDATWHTPGDSTVAGVARGRDAVFALFGRYGGETHGTFTAELLDVFEGSDDHVIGRHHNSGVRDGRQLDTDCCIIFELSDGRVTSGRECFSDLANWDQFWS